MQFLRLSNRPRPVRWAIWLLLGGNVVSLLLSLARAVVDSGSTTATSLILVVIGFTAVMDLGLVLAIACGRRWAFILYVVVFVGSLASFVSSVRVDLGEGLPVFTWYVLSSVVDAVGIALLLMPSARDWFTASKVARSDGVRVS
jgi:hypothetical protein